MDLRTRPRIGIMGPSDCSPRAYDLAREVGLRVARAGAILICGGGTGVMEAAASGAKDGEGITVGILPGGSPAQGNPYIDLPVVTDMGNARNVINVLTSQAIIAIHGAYGTLSEIALALKCGTPVIALESWELVPPGGSPRPEIIRAATPEEAVSAALAAIAKRVP
jgi:uncharacterized protein (TIGR00725 family)